VVVRDAGLAVRKSFTAHGYWRPEQHAIPECEAIWKEWLDKLSIELSTEENERGKARFIQEVALRKDILGDDGRFHIVVGRKGSFWLKPMIY
jgi:hypothetical protein